jgi:hypothetical protein
MSPCCPTSQAAHHSPSYKPVFGRASTARCYESQSILEGGIMSLRMRSFLIYGALIAIILCCTGIASGQRMEVKITKWETFKTNYSSVIPGQCYSNGYCNGPTPVSYDVAGAKLWLHLPDGRTAIVSCNGKYLLKLDGINLRDCRIPSVNNFEAEFKGVNAKLKWRVTIGLNGEKIESETYTILSVLNK